MLSVGARLVRRALPGACAILKPTKTPTKLKAVYAPLCAYWSRYSSLIPRKLLCNTNVRFMHSSKEDGSVGETVESLLEQTAILAAQLTPELKKSDDRYLPNIDAQIQLLQRALNLAVNQNRDDKVAIFVSLVKTCDVHQLAKTIVIMVEEHPEMLELEEVAREGIPGLYAEALFAEGRFGDAKAIAASASERLFSLPHIPTEALVISLFNLGAIEQHCSLIDDSIRTYKRAIALTKVRTESTPVSGASIASPSASPLSNNQPTLGESFPPEDLNRISPHLTAMLHSNVAGLLLEKGRKTEAIPHLKASVDLRETLLKQDTQDESLRNLYVRSMEALSGTLLELNRSDASQLVWERASLVLEYGGDSTDFFAKELVEVEQELQQPLNSKSQLAAVKHRHGRALVACHTQKSLNDAIKPLKLACDTYRELDDKLGLLDALEDLTNAYEALAYASTSEHASKEAQPNAFLEEQIATFGECLAVSEALNGALHPEHARYLTNLAIFTAARGEKSRAKDLIRAAIYICDKAGLAQEEEMVARAQTVRVFLMEEAEPGSKTTTPPRTAGGTKPNSSKGKTSGKWPKM